MFQKRLYDGGRVFPFNRMKQKQDAMLISCIGISALFQQRQNNSCNVWVANSWIISVICPVRQRFSGMRQSDVTFFAINRKLKNRNALSIIVGRDSAGICPLLERLRDSGKIAVFHGHNQILRSRLACGIQRCAAKQNSENDRQIQSPRTLKSYHHQAPAIRATDPSERPISAIRGERVGCEKRRLAGSATRHLAPPYGPADDGQSLRLLPLQ